LKNNFFQVEKLKKVLYIKSINLKKKIMLIIQYVNRVPKIFLKHEYFFYVHSLPKAWWKNKKW